MKRSRLFWMALLVAGLALGIWRVWAVVGVKPKADDRPPVVEFVTAREVSPPNQLRFTGTVQPASQALVCPRAGGRVKRVLVQNGDVVSAGQSLVLLEGADYERAAAASRATFQKAEANLANLRKTGERLRALHAQGAVSAKELEDILLAITVAESDLQAAAAGLAAAEENLKETVITAPSPGLIANRMVIDGQMIQAGTPLMAVVGLERIEVLFNLNQEQTGEVRCGQKVAVSLPGEDKVIEGAVEHVSATSLPYSRLFEVRAGLPNPDQLLKPGMLVQVGVDDGNLSKVLAVPQTSVWSKDGRFFVFVLSGEKVSTREVKPGLVMQSMVEITSGLRAGEIVAASGVGDLRDGQVVRPQQRG